MFTAGGPRRSPHAGRRTQHTRTTTPDHIVWIMRPICAAITNAAVFHRLEICRRWLSRHVSATATFGLGWILSRLGTRILPPVTDPLIPIKIANLSWWLSFARTFPASGLRWAGRFDAMEIGEGEKMGVEFWMGRLIRRRERDKVIRDEGVSWLFVLLMCFAKEADLDGVYGYLSFWDWIRKVRLLIWF